MNLPKIIRLEVSLKDHREVERLKARIAELEEERDKLKALKNRFEYDLVCQQQINLRLWDYCQDYKIDIPKRLFTVFGVDGKTIIR